MDKIILKDITLFAYHGVNDDEKQNGQIFSVCITLFLDLKKPSKTDKLRDTVNYAAVIKTVKNAFCKKSYNLIERAADEIMTAVFNDFESVAEILITLKKPEAPVNADLSYAAVEMRRSRL